MRPEIRAALFVIMIVIVVVVAYLYLVRPEASSNGPVTVSRYGFQGSPSGLCPYFATSEPAAPFSVASSSSFQISWEVRCTANSTPTRSVLQSMYSLTAGFIVLDSSLPLAITEGSFADLTVTVRAPSAPFDGTLSFWVNATS
jgi:hypothetical protein